MPTIYVVSDIEQEQYWTDLSTAWQEHYAATHLIDVAYNAYDNAIRRLADYVEFIDGSPDVYEASPENTQIIESFWRTYLDLYRLLRQYLIN